MLTDGLPIVTTDQKRNRCEPGDESQISPVLDARALIRTSVVEMGFSCVDPVLETGRHNLIVNAAATGRLWTTPCKRLPCFGVELTTNGTNICTYQLCCKTRYG